MPLADAIAEMLAHRPRRGAPFRCGPSPMAAGSHTSCGCHESLEPHVFFSKVVARGCPAMATRPRRQRLIVLSYPRSSFRLDHRRVLASQELLPDCRYPLAVQVLAATANSLDSMIMYILADRQPEVCHHMQTTHTLIPAAIRIDSSL
jgi:hypothetical protein